MKEPISNPEELKDILEGAEGTFQMYLHGLQLHEEDLRGKTILDIGSGASEFSQVAQEKDLDVTIIDLDPKVRSSKVPEGTKAVRGVAARLPFKDNSFDLVVSRSAVPILLKDIQSTWMFPERDELRREILLNSLKEALRVTKPGGEVRMNPVPSRNRDEIDRVLLEEIQDASRQICIQGDCDVILIEPTLVLRKKKD